HLRLDDMLLRKADCDESADVERLVAQARSAAAGQIPQPDRAARPAGADLERAAEEGDSRMDAIIGVRFGIGPGRAHLWRSAESRYVGQRLSPFASRDCL